MRAAKKKHKDEQNSGYKDRVHRSRQKKKGKKGIGKISEKEYYCFVNKTDISCDPVN